jgi:hypothetical protein
MMAHMVGCPTQNLSIDVRLGARARPTTTRGGPEGPPRDGTAFGRIRDYQVLPVQPLQLRATLPVVGSLVIVNVLLDFDVAVTA